MALKVRLHARAQADLRAIRDYLLEHAGPRPANRVRLHLREKMALLSESPNIGAQTSIPQIRILPPTRYPYRIYYTVVADAVIVLHVRHTARQAPERGDLDD
ncbi:MAG: type II toxin-antitoxin system RelE/ParE family toxin [Hyphomicrobium sp.]